MTTQAVPRERRRVLPEGRGAGWFGLAGFVNAVGTGFFYPFSLLFFQATTNLPMHVIGLGLTGTALAVLPAMVWVGRLADRFGSRQVLVAAGLSRAVSFAGFVAVPNLAGFLLFGAVVALGNRAEHGITPVLATSLAPAGTEHAWLALTRTVFNAGMGLGALLGGLVLISGDSGMVALGLVNAASFSCAALLYCPLPNDRPASRREGQATTNPWRHRVFLRLAIARALLWLVAIAVEIGLPVYLVTVLHQPLWTVSVLFAVNTCLLTLLHLPLAGVLRTHRPLLVAATGAVLYCGLLGPLGLAGAGTLVLVAGMAVYTIGELMTSQAMLVLLTATAPPAERGAYLAFTQVFTGIATALAPTLVTVLLGHWAPGLWWTLLAIALVVAVALARMSGRGEA